MGFRWDSFKLAEPRICVSLCILNCKSAFKYSLRIYRDPAYLRVSRSRRSLSEKSLGFADPNLTCLKDTTLISSLRSSTYAKVEVA